MALALTATVLCCPSLAQDSLSKDAIAIYKTFLGSYYSGSHERENIADQTEVFNPGFDEESAASCLKEVHIPANASGQTHALDASIIPDGFKVDFVSARDKEKSIRDPGDAIRGGEPVDDAVEKGIAAGVMTLSEIAFNAPHTRAVMSYSFHCGRLCGNGGAILLENRHGRWVRAKQVCGGWVS